MSYETFVNWIKDNIWFVLIVIGILLLIANKQIRAKIRANKEKKKSMSQKNRKIMGPVLIVIGLLLIGRTFDLFHFDFGDLIRALIPLGIIFLGVWMIMRRKRIEDKMKVEVHFDGHSTYSGHQTSSTSHFSSSSLGGRVFHLLCSQKYCSGC